jgi:hypothetical protein
VHPRYGTPWVSLVVSSAIYSVFILGPFPSLVGVDGTIYAAALLLQFAALVVLRINRPDMERPYRIPGGWFGIVWWSPCRRRPLSHSRCTSRPTTRAGGLDRARADRLGDRTAAVPVAAAMDRRRSAEEPDMVVAFDEPGP